ncbi:MAG: putative DNA binding domain-containing protein [Elusimicrobiales bacterium]|nr:putative DNA binding domain-containing protein [Elusimicrobiales bacterium]
MSQQDEISEKKVLERLNALRLDRYTAFQPGFNWEKADDCARARCVRDAMALANAGGGWLLFGVTEDGVKGLSREESAALNADSFNEFLNGFTLPEFRCRVHKLRMKYLEKMRNVAVIDVPGLSGYPVICIADVASPDGRSKILESGAVYVRAHSGGSEKSAGVDAMRAAIRRVVDDALRKKGFQAGGSPGIMSELAQSAGFFNSKSEGEFSKYGYWELMTYPSVYKPDRIRPAGLKKLFDAAQFAGNGFWFFQPRGYGVFPGGVQYVYSTPVSLECARAYRSGGFAWRSVIREDYGLPSDGAGRVLPLESAVELIARFFLFTDCFYRRLRLDCGLNVHILLHRAAQRRLQALSPVHAGGGEAVARVESAAVLKSFTAEQLSAPKANAIAAALEFVSLFNWRDGASARGSVARIVEAVFSRFEERCAGGW